MKITVFKGYGNVYVVENDNKQAVIIDTGMEENEVMDYLNKNGITPVYLLLTHGHYDHCFMANFYTQRGVKVYMSDKENNMMNMSWHVPPHLKDSFKSFEFESIEDGQILDLIGLRFKAVFTPGHTAGSFCFILNDEYMFTGDTLFYQTVGATDYPMGDTDKLRESIKMLFSMDEDYVIYPGHGKSTTLSHEKEFNTIAKSL